MSARIVPIRSETRQPDAPASGLDAAKGIMGGLMGGVVFWVVVVMIWRLCR